MTSTTPTAAPTAADLDAARLLLDRLGVSPADLLTAAPDRAPAPTFADYIPVVRAAVSPGTRRIYGSYWNRITEHWGTRRLDEPTPTEIQQLAEQLKAGLTVRRNARGGRGATEHLIAALRCLYRHAEADNLIPAGSNPARKVPKPRRLPLDPPRGRRHPPRRDQPGCRDHRPVRALTAAVQSFRPDRLVICTCRRNSRPGCATTWSTGPARRTPGCQ